MPRSPGRTTERAVRAALAIRDTVAALGGRQVRIGITTGEALIALEARPESGEGMASGDVVNTAARLQGAAPVDGILVDETTWRATNRVIEYRDHEPVTVKGKRDPVIVHEAVAARSRFGVDIRAGSRTPLVGRTHELDLLAGALVRARNEREPQLVTIIGVPGIGKSRLVWELFQQVDAGAEIVRWRQGRALPYAEGVSFWALGEIVKAEAGILDADSPEEAGTKLSHAIVGVLASAGSTDTDTGRIERHLRPLVGLETSVELRGDHRGEAFDAWTRYLEALAAWILVRAGRWDEAGAFLDELAGYGILEIESGVEGCLALLTMGRSTDLTRLAGGTPPGRWHDLFGLIASGNLAEAARVAGAMGALPQAALLSFAAAERSAEQGHTDEVRERLAPAVEFWRSVGATYYLSMAENLAARLDAGRALEESAPAG